MIGDIKKLKRNKLLYVLHARYIFTYIYPLYILVFSLLFIIIIYK